MEFSALTPINASPMSQIKTPNAEDKAAQLKQASEGFESLFLQEMLKAGRSASLAEDNLFTSSAVKTSESLLDAELAKSSAGQAGLGIAEAIYQQFEPHVTGKRS
jgi:flagellar protein FlgJ